MLNSNEKITPAIAAARGGASGCAELAMTPLNCKRYSRRSKLDVRLPGCDCGSLLQAHEMAVSTDAHEIDYDCDDVPDDHRS